MRYCLRTRYAETGQDGIIHNSSYAVFLEEARIEYLRVLGYDINELERIKKIYCPVVEFHLRYLKPLYSGEEIAIDVSLEEISKVRFTFHYQVFRGKDLIAVGSTMHCFTNANFKPLPNFIGRASHVLSA